MTTFSPTEAAVVTAAARESGWAVGGWVGAVVETGLGLGQPPGVGSERMVAWGVLREAAERLEACLDNARRLAAGGEGGWSGGRTAEAAGRIGAWSGMQVVAVRKAETARLAAAARVAVAAVEGLVPGSRRGSGARSGEVGGSGKRRVEVLFSPASASVILGMTRAGGWAAADWVAAVAAFTAAQMVAGNTAGEAATVRDLADRLHRAAGGLHEVVISSSATGEDGKRVAGGLAVVQRETSLVEDVMAGLLAEPGRLDPTKGGEEVTLRPAHDVFVSLGWPIVSDSAARKVAL